MMAFYTYLWLREDGTPYYVGKGKGNRAFNKAMHRQFPPPKERIVIYPVESEADAFEAEVALIWYYGRKDLGTGCLRNLTDGGDGSSGYVHTQEAKEKIGLAKNHLKRTVDTFKKISASHTGMKRSEAHRRHTSEGLKGKPSWNKGKVLSVGHRRKLAEAKIGKRGNHTGHKHSEEVRKKISDALWQRKCIRII
jgi:hypothetical protein